MEAKELELLRNSIREIDKDLVVLFEKRMTLSKAIAQVKLKSELPIFDAGREEENIQNLIHLLENPKLKSLFVPWYRKLMDLSKDVQSEFIRGEKNG